MTDDAILVATSSFSTTINGVPRVVTKGETFREGHPVVEGREELFKPFAVDNELETATAAPGERRQTPPKGESGDGDPGTATPPNGDGDPAAAGDTTGRPAGDDTPRDYSDLKRPELVKELETRGIEAPKGVAVKNAALIELLEANDAEARALSQPADGAGDGLAAQS